MTITVERLNFGVLEYEDEHELGLIAKEEIGSEFFLPISLGGFLACRPGNTFPIYMHASVIFTIEKSVLQCVKSKKRVP